MDIFEAAEGLPMPGMSREGVFALSRGGYMPRPKGPPQTKSAKRRAPDGDSLSEVMRHTNGRAELLYHKLSDTCEGEPLAVVALARQAYCPCMGK